jgi:phage gpG-like protein
MLSGDFSKLQALTRLLGELNPTFSKAVENSAREIERLIVREFDTQRDPYGGAWTPLKPATIKRKGSSRILVDSGALKDSVRVDASGSKVRILMNDYALFHQTGTSRLPVRKILPDDEIPPAWDQAIKLHFENIMTDIGRIAA